MSDWMIKSMVAVNMRKAVVSKWLARYNKVEFKKTKEEIIRGAFKYH